MLFINAGVGFWQEFKADNAIALLETAAGAEGAGHRDGAWKDIEARLLVPGDVVLVKLGNIVPADVKLVEGAYLSVDQSALTGESLPVDKKVGDDAYSGSIAKQGEMTGVVTATGMKTYFGKTAHLVEQAKTVSHFQRAVLRIGNFLILVTIGLVLVIGAGGVVPPRPIARNHAVCAHPDGRLDSGRLAGRAFRHHGDRRRTSGGIQGDRLASRRDRRDGRHGHAVQRQDRHADQERTDARRYRAGAKASRATNSFWRRRWRRVATRRTRSTRRSSPAPARQASRLRREGVPSLRSGRQAGRGGRSNMTAPASRSPKVRRR